MGGCLSRLGAACAGLTGNAQARGGRAIGPRRRGDTVVTPYLLARCLVSVSYCKQWSRRADSNRGPADYESMLNRSPWRSTADPQGLVSPLVADRWTDEDTYDGELCKKLHVTLQESKLFVVLISDARSPSDGPRAPASQPTQGFPSPWCSSYKLCTNTCMYTSSVSISYL